MIFFPPCVLILTADSCLLFAVLFHHSGAAKVVAAGLVTVGGGIGGTVLYAKWDPKFRSAVEKNVPYSDKLFGLALGPASQDAGLPIRKQVRIGSQHILTNALRSAGCFNNTTGCERENSTP